MSQRLLATALALILLFGLATAALFVPLPYVTYDPGPTVDVLGEENGKEIVQVTGHQTYRDEGELRMTTVFVTSPDSHISLFDAMDAWLSDERGIYPYDAVYAPGETAEQSKTESAVEMVTSQDAAIATALRELGYDLTPTVEVLNVADGFPSEGKLEVRDVLVKVGDTTITKPDDVLAAIKAAPEGEALNVAIIRDEKPLTVAITPRLFEGERRIGITTGPGYTFPFQVEVNIDADIGGPSAGLLFSLGIYDTLTPGSLTGDRVVAGTGTIDDTGKVGPIGGIQQKIVAASKAGAELFLVPAANCADAVGAPRGDLRLVKISTMHEAVGAIETWTQDDAAALPACAGDS
jgi:PDZ domain-containing protein